MTSAIAAPPLPLHVGFTGTRHGMSEPQRRAVADRLTVLADIHRVPIVAHHGCCVGADEEFHEICRQPDIRARIIGHPGPDWPDGELCARVLCDETRPPGAYMKRNAAIVTASRIMIAAPLQDDPIRGALGTGRRAAVWGGTWRTIGMARRALRAGKLRELYVVGRDGKLLDHGAWPW